MKRKCHDCDRANSVTVIPVIQVMKLMEAKLRDTNEVLSSKLEVIQVLQTELGKQWHIFASRNFPKLCGKSLRSFLLLNFRDEGQTIAGERYCC